MNPYLLLVLEALLFVLAFGALSWLRGEGLPGRLAAEAAVFTVASVSLSWVARVAIHPVLFLVLVYLVTMRARLLVDLGNTLSARGRYEQALAALHLGSRLSSDPSAQALARINTGVVWMRQKRFEQAVVILNDALVALPHQRGSPKLEAACRYNLGLAYLRLGEEANALQQLNKVIELMPNSLYARGAESALRQRGTKADLTRPEAG